MASDEKENREPKSKKKLIIISSIVVFLVVAVLICGYFLYINRDTDTSPVVAEVKGQKIHLSEYKERLFAAGGGLGTPTEPTVSEATDGIKEPVLNELVELKIIDKELAKKKIKITDSELEQAAKEKFIAYDSYSEEAQKALKDYVRLSVGKEKLLARVASWKEGFILYCYFNRADQSDIKNKPEAADMRAKQEVYAKNLCTKSKERLETGKSDYQTELATIALDPEIGEAAWKPYTMPFGEELRKDTFSGKNFHPAFDLFNQVSALSNDKNRYYLLTLQDTVMKGSDEANLTPEKRAAVYAVVYIRDGNQGETTDFDKWLQDKQPEYKVKTYVDRISL